MLTVCFPLLSLSPPFIQCVGSKISTNMAMAPSRDQSKKHQINSLAVAAVSMELQMLERAGSRNVSKSVTQGKYGW